MMPEGLGKIFDPRAHAERLLAFWTYGVLLANGLCALAFLALFFRHQIAALSLAAVGVLIGCFSIWMHRRVSKGLKQ